MRKIFFVLVTTILLGAVFAGAINALSPAASTSKATLSNVRAYAPAIDDGSVNFAVDGGELFAGQPSDWDKIALPAGVIANAVAVDANDAALVYVGAANELAIYRSADSGQNWMRIPLSSDYIGGVTAIAVDSAQRLVYVGTDTAGLFRLRDVGSSMLVSAHLMLNEPVIDVAVDAGGSGLAFARTAWALYRAENFGLRWSEVENLGSTPTALVVSSTNPATIYVGTVDRGLLQSNDGLTWTTANAGLGMTPGSRLQVDALAIDPAQPDVLYVATSYLFGSTTVHQTPVGVAMSVDGGASWSQLSSLSDVAVADLLPVSGQTGSVYALTSASRTPLALGNAPTVAAATVADQAEANADAVNSGWLAWVVAGLAAMALLFAVVTDMRKRQRESGSATLAPSLVQQKR